jgi:hypothetical protein
VLSRFFLVWLLNQKLPHMMPIIISNLRARHRCCGAHGKMEVPAQFDQIKGGMACSWMDTRRVQYGRRLTTCYLLRTYTQADWSVDRKPLIQLRLTFYCRSVFHTGRPLVSTRWIRLNNYPLILHNNSSSRHR